MATAYLAPELRALVYSRLLKWRLCGKVIFRPQITLLKPLGTALIIATGGSVGILTREDLVNAHNQKMAKKQMLKKNI